MGLTVQDKSVTNGLQKETSVAYKPFKLHVHQIMTKEEREVRALDSEEWSNTIPCYRSVQEKREFPWSVALDKHIH